MARRCRSGRHRPAKVAWNCGFRFSTCERCGRDIVSRGYEGWQLPPRGTRVSWRAVSPARYLLARPDPKFLPSPRDHLDLTPISLLRDGTPRLATGRGPIARAPAPSTAIVAWTPAVLSFATLLAILTFRRRRRARA